MERYERGPLMPDNPRWKPAMNVWAIALWVGGAALVFVSLLVAARIVCWYGCVAPFDETWQRRIAAAEFAREQVASLVDGERQVVALPDEYADLSETGEATVERVDGKLVVILLHEELTGSSAFVHAPSGVAEQGRFLDAYCITGVHSQGASWYEIFLGDYVPSLGCR